MNAVYKKYCLQFKQASGTSRGVLKIKNTWFICITHNGKSGIGECGMFEGLSIDDRSDFETQLQWVCTNINLGLEKLLEHVIEYPSIQFGLEMAFKALESDTPFEIFPSAFTKSEAAIPINGLIWMGTEAFMKQQISDKLKAGFNCIKMKIGAIDFDTELKLLESIRNEFSSDVIELRVDANGAFMPQDALEKLKRLSDLDLHSIEQPIKQGQTEAMAALCEATPLPIALDEELIGVFHKKDKQQLLEAIKPQYIILKPTLVGGLKGSDEWIDLATKNSIGWWVTSALESNIGLNAIAQYTFTKQSKMPQGLGTGALFTNNFESPLHVKQGVLHYDNTKKWEITL